MYTLGDKYDIPGLRTYSCTTLDDLARFDMVRKWDKEVDIYEMAYQKSRDTDQLREWLIEQIYSDMLQYNQASEWQLYSGLYPFLERSPDLAVALLKKMKEHIDDRR